MKPVDPRAGARLPPKAEAENTMATNRKSPAVAALAELDDLNYRLATGQRMLQRLKNEHVQIATAEKDVVFREDKTTLYHYRPTTKRAIGVPVLVAYGQIGRYTMTDLQEDRSLLRNLLALGVDVYAVDWGSPARGDRWLRFEDYVDVYLADCIEHICRAHDVPAINLLGICEGGIFSLCYAALYPKRVKNLILAITPVDFHQDQAEGRPHHGFINLWTRSLGAEDIDQMIDAYGNLSGELMSQTFAQMTPGATLSKYNVGLLDTFADEKKLLNFLRMEKWIADRPHHPGEAAKQLLVNLYKNNELIRGEFSLGDRTVRLADIKAPILNIYAKEDHIIPPQTTKALRGAVGSRDYSEIGLDGGHVGVFVSGKSQGVLGKGIVDWLRSRD